MRRNEEHLPPTMSDTLPGSRRAATPIPRRKNRGPVARPRPNAAIWQARIPGPAVYQLLIEVLADVTIQVGAIGRLAVPAGWYVYSGSAKRNAGSRVARHIRRRKTRRWHIDWLLTLPESRVAAVRWWHWAQGLECAVNRETMAACDAQILAAGFGSSDCRAGCRSHFARLARSIEDVATWSSNQGRSPAGVWIAGQNQIGLEPRVASDTT